MVKQLKAKLDSFTNKGTDARTNKTVKNVFVSFFVKGLSIVINFVLVPLTINYINPERYGIWLIVSSAILWFNFFDFGLGGGLRNKLAEAIALKDVKAARTLISTTYGALIFITFIIALVFSILNNYIKWDSFLGLSVSYRKEVQNLMGILILLFCIQFVLQVINTINLALQKAALVSITYLLGNIFSLVFVFILKHTIAGSLFYLGVALFSGNLLSLLVFTFYFFGIQRKDLLPSYKYVSYSASKGILNLGGKFFIIQIAALVQYESTNILISRYFSSVRVTEYNIAYKLFSTIIMLFAIIITPMWSAVTEAQSLGDYVWIKKTEKKLLKVWLGLALLSVVILFFSPIIYRVWVGSVVKISFLTSVGVMLYAVSMTFGTIYVNILNGLGRLKTQFYLSIITMILFIPLSYFLSVKLQLGIFGLSLSLILANINGIIAAPIELKNLYKSKLR